MGNYKLAGILALLALIQIVNTSISQDPVLAFCMNLLGKNISQEENQTESVISQAENASLAKNQTGQAEQKNFSFSQDYWNAVEMLKKANDTIQKLREMGIPFVSVQDKYLIALQWFKGQEALELDGETGDYTFIKERLDEIEDIKNNAIKAKDELSAYEQRVKEADPDANLSESIRFQSEAKKEFEDGRFLNAIYLINQAYEKLLEEEANAARSRTLVSVARRNIENFIYDNWQSILGILAAASITFAFFQKQIQRFVLKSKIESLKHERTVIEGMIKSLQKEYFEGKVNETSYRIKSKKFGEMLMDINRKIPMLEEELQKKRLEEKRR